MNTSVESVKTFECYQCEKDVLYLFDDSRCKDCTRLSIKDVQGHDCYGENNLGDEHYGKFSNER